MKYSDDRREVRWWCYLLPVVLRRGREEHDDKHDDGDEEAEIERVTTDLSPATPACGLLYHHTVTVFQSEAEVLRIVLDSFITADVPANKLEIFISLITREVVCRPGLWVRHSGEGVAYPRARALAPPSSLDTSWPNLDKKQDRGGGQGRHLDLP